MNSQFSIDTMNFTKENIQTTIDTVNAMKMVNQLQKDQMKNINLDEVEDLRDDMEEMAWEQREMQEAMNMATNYNSNIDESDLDAELNQYAFDMQMNNIPVVNANKLPSVQQSQASNNQPNVQIYK